MNNVHSMQQATLIACVFAVSGACANEFDSVSAPAVVKQLISDHCLDCHDAASAEAGLDLESISYDLDRHDVFDRWVEIHDRIRAGEMPPPDDHVPVAIAEIGWSLRPVAEDVSDSESEPQDEFRQRLRDLASWLADHDQRRIRANGRAKVRRLNRHEYEHALQAALHAPWLQVADLLPEDGVDHLFNKIGERLDVSHVQLTRYLETAEHALRKAISVAGHPSETRRFYAREESSQRNYLHYRFGQTAATRSIVPLVELTPELDVIRKRKPVTVGDADAELREREAMGVFSGVYSATTKYDFTRVDAPTDGLYRLRFKTYTFMAGPNGASGGDDHGLTGGKTAWWRPDRNVTFAGQRDEPITLYALAASGDSRWLTTFNSTPDPSVFECLVELREGEGIRPDAARLVRTRPGWSGNPNASRDGVPGFAMNWLEVTGPITETWPPASYRAVFGDLPFEVDDDGRVRAQSDHPAADARRLLTALQQRCAGDRELSADAIAPYLQIFARASSLGQDFTDALILSAAALLCSPDFLYLDAQPGPLSEWALKQRLAYFLWNGPADAEWFAQRLGDTRISDTGSAAVLDGLVDEMLDDPRSDRFIAAFLDYWLDLRDINANTPDATLYPDYYLDELLTESSVLETRLFFRELIRQNLPVESLVDANFAIVNERLADHYGLPKVEGVELRRVELPPDSVRGGLLTQASVLRVTANGTTTSPVLRGSWVVERILGTEIPPPPSGVAAVEPDIRGAETIREQLDQHRAAESCRSCHAKFDGVGFALESFDVAGGWRAKYRSVGSAGTAAEGIGKNGHRFEFRWAQPVDDAGTLSNGVPFADVRELKCLLREDPRQLARNLLNQWVTYATGAAVSFADRAAIEAMLDQAADGGTYPMRCLLHQVVQSQLFRRK